MDCLVWWRESEEEKILKFELKGKCKERKILIFVFGIQLFSPFYFHFFPKSNKRKYFVICVFFPFIFFPFIQTYHKGCDHNCECASFRIKDSPLILLIGYFKCSSFLNLMAN
ncbi:hypothetical protein E2542_SST24227 [Spatholobus suberectus]|nr:hypothetical protein E2542_SST24227 [Spatholobus suberectus]